MGVSRWAQLAEGQTGLPKLNMSSAFTFDKRHVITNDTSNPMTGSRWAQQPDNQAEQPTQTPAGTIKFQQLAQPAGDGKARSPGKNGRGKFNGRGNGRGGFGNRSNAKRN